MRPKHLYLILGILGTILPYSQFIPFLHEHGLNLGLFVEQLFANRISAFFGLDVLVSSVVLWVLLVYLDGRRYSVRHLWAPILGNLVAGVSLGLPLFLYMREGQLDNSPASVRPQHRNI